MQLGNSWKKSKRHNHFAGPTDPLEGLIKLKVFNAENTDIELRKLPKNIKTIHCSSPKDKELKEQTTKIETPPKSNNN